MAKLSTVVLLLVALVVALVGVGVWASDEIARQQIETDMIAYRAEMERHQVWRDQAIAGQREWQQHELQAQHAPMLASAGVYAQVAALALPLLGAFLFVLAAGRYAWYVASGERSRVWDARQQAQHWRDIEIERARHRHQLPPAHYAPSVTYAPAPRISGSAPVDVPALDHAELPGVVDLASLSHTPTLGAILLGIGAGNTPITVSASALMHTGLLGSTGGGKSNTGRLLLAQLLAAGVPCVVADPHFAAYDAESGEDWRPIAQRLHLAPAVQADQIGDLLRWLSDEMARRMALRASGERVGKPLVVYADELPAIVQNVPGAMDTLGSLLREGRKVRLYLVTSSQDLLASTLKTGSEIRENLRTAFYSGGATNSAVPLLDMPRKEISQYESQLGQGMVLLRSSATSPAQLVRVPLASNQSIAALLPDNLHQRAETLDIPPAVQGVGNGAAKAYTAEERRILDMFKSGASVAEIAREVSGAKNGRRYTDASERVQSIVRGGLGGLG